MNASVTDQEAVRLVEDEGAVKVSEETELGGRV